MTIQPSSSPVAPAPRITVVMTAFNAAGTIERALDSVLTERDIPLEIIVVDDGSSDDSAAVVARVATADPRVILVRAPANEGVSKARNRALDVARGTWLTFLDADDRLLPGAIPILMAPTADPSVRVVVGQRIWTNGEKEWRSKFYDIPDITEPGRKSIRTHPGLLYYGSATGKIFHRSLLDGLRFEGRVIGDLAWGVSAMLRAEQAIEVVADDVYEWWRPIGDDVTTISLQRHRSVPRAVANVRSAIRSYASVSAEVGRRVGDPRVQQSLRQAYFERLVRADLVRPIQAALRRHDPDIGELFLALAAFLAAPAREVVVASSAVVRDAILPARGVWSWLPRAGRDGYWELVRSVARIDRDIASKLLGGGGRASRFTLKVVVRVPGRAGNTLATAILGARGVARRIRRRLQPA